MKPFMTLKHISVKLITNKLQLSHEYFHSNFNKVNPKNSVTKTYIALLIQLNKYLFRNIFHGYLRCKNINNNMF